MAPMTRGRCPDGIPTDEVREYYERRAGDLGLIITEGVYIDHRGAGASASVPRLDSIEAAESWKSINDAVHAKGAKIFPQLWHLGVVRRAGDAPFPEAPVFTPSGLSLSGKKITDEPTVAEIQEVVAAFGRSAALAKQAGFDGVEVHGAHGYLIDQFLWQFTNRRNDSYGGSIEARVRFACEVVESVRDAVGKDYPICLRLSQWKAGRWDEKIAETPDEYERILLPLVKAGVDIFHPSTRRFWQPAFAGSDLTLAGWTKKITGKPTIMVGHVGVDTAFLADEPSEDVKTADLQGFFDSGQFDLLAIGRALLADPQWVSKTVSGQESEIHAYTKASEQTYF